MRGYLHLTPNTWESTTGSLNLMQQQQQIPNRQNMLNNDLIFKPQSTKAKTLMMGNQGGKSSDSPANCLPRALSLQCGKRELVEPAC